MALFGLIFGFFFYSATAYFVVAGLRAQMGGGQQPMSINDYVIAPLLGNASVVGLFLIPLISMRLFAEEKRTGTIELLMTSPVSDWEIILGKWLGAMTMYLCVLAVSALNVALLFAWGRPDWRPILTGYLGLHPAGRHGAGHRNLHLHHYQKPDHRRRRHVLRLPAALGPELGQSVITTPAGPQAVAYCSILTHFEPFSKGIIDTKDLVFYVSAIFLGLFLTSRSLESLRWRA